MGTTDRYHTRWCLAEGSNRLPQLFLKITEQLSPRCRINLKKQRLEKATGVRGTRKEYWRPYRHLVHQKSKLFHWNEKKLLNEKLKNSNPMKERKIWTGNFNWERLDDQTSTGVVDIDVAANVVVVVAVWVGFPHSLPTRKRCNLGPPILQVVDPKAGLHLERRMDQCIFWVWIGFRGLYLKIMAKICPNS